MLAVDWAASHTVAGGVANVHSVFRSVDWGSDYKNLAVNSNGTGANGLVRGFAWGFVMAFGVMAVFRDVNCFGVVVFSGDVSDGGFRVVDSVKLHGE